MAVHPLAVVDPTAEIHPEASVGPFCVVGPGVTLAANVELRNHATVYGRCFIDEGTVVFPGAVIASDPQDLKFRGENSEVRIGKNCRIHECVTISKGTAGGGLLTEVGDHCLLMAYSHVAHDCRLADHVVLGNSAQLAGHVVVGRRVVISGLAGIHHFVTIGELSFIAGMAGVRQDVPPYMMMEGHPAEARGVNLVGLRRDGWSDEDIQAAKDVFRCLYKDRNGKPLSRIVDDMAASPTGQCKPGLRLCAWMKDNLMHAVKGRVLEAARH